MYYIKFVKISLCSVLLKGFLRKAISTISLFISVSPLRLLPPSVFNSVVLSLSLSCPQARAGMISTVEVLKVMEAFVNEPNYTVWSDLSCNLGVLSSLLSHTDFHEDIQEFIRDLFTPIGMKLGWDSRAGEGESQNSKFIKG